MTDYDPPIRARAAVLGKPIAHSLSPVLHMAAYRALGLSDWYYDRQEVGEDDLADFLAQCDDSWQGLSVTMPLKKRVMEFGTPRDQWSRTLQVANTVLIDHAQDTSPLLLCNTDVYGIVRAFDHAWEKHPSFREANEGQAVILGNGNTAVSALAACITLGFIHEVTVAARHPDHSQHLIALGQSHGLRVHSIALADSIPVLTHACLVINTIPGHGADTIATQLTASKQRVYGTLLDVVYDPRPTALMNAWQHAGGLAIGGQEMLLYQAVAQVLLMTGYAQPGDFDTYGHEPKHPRVEQAMRTALEEVL